MKKHIPNIITCSRIAAVLSLLLTQLFTPAFYILYTYAALTDCLDGYLARRFDAVSLLGRRLDSAADLIMMFTLLWKCFPVLWLELPYGIWFIVAAVLVLRAALYIVSAVRLHTFASLHTMPTRLGTVVLCLMPYSLPFSVAANIHALIAVAVSAFAAVWDLVRILRMPRKAAAEAKEQS